MTIDQFTERRRAVWVELEQAIRTARRGRLNGTTARDLERFGVLYRHAQSDLAIARRDFEGTATAAYLNTLCSRAHPLLYRGDPWRPGGIVDFYARGLPRAFRREWPFMVASGGLLFLGVLVGWLVLVARPQQADSLVPTGSLFYQIASGQDPEIPNPLLAALAIMVNNIKVVLICFGLGVTLGMGTALALVVNGMQLGTLGWAVANQGIAVAFWSMIVPHGTIELSIIAFGGGTGLMLAWSVLRPGLIGRLDALAEAGRRAVTLAVGLAPLLVVCGCIEGFLSPSPAPQVVKFAVGIITLVALYGWLLFAGREPAAPANLELGGSAAAPPPAAVPAA